MGKGKVKFFYAGKGFGIVIDDATNNEIFIHFSQINDEAKVLLENEEVEYEVIDSNGSGSVKVKTIRNNFNLIAFANFNPLLAGSTL